jgi:hypothetical protein
MLYVHPREIDPAQPRLKLRWMQSKIHYFGVRGCEKKLRDLLVALPGSLMCISDALCGADPLVRTGPPVPVSWA